MVTSGVRRIEEPSLTGLLLYKVTSGVRRGEEPPLTGLLLYTVYFPGWTSANGH